MPSSLLRRKHKTLAGPPRIGGVGMFLLVNVLLSPALVGLVHFGMRAAVRGTSIRPGRSPRFPAAFRDCDERAVQIALRLAEGRLAPGSSSTRTVRSSS